MPEGSSLTIPAISQAEGLSVPNAAKLMRLLRMGGMVNSERGQSGGYTLCKPPDQIKVADVIRVLGGQFFTPEFCNRHSGLQQQCAHQSDCSLRVLWTTIQTVLTDVLGKTTLKDLLCNEAEMQEMLQTRSNAMFPMQAAPCKPGVATEDSLPEP
jgi:Rrf2 family protein